MIDPSSTFGRVMLVFFWGGVSASLINALWVFLRFDPLYIAWLVVFVNMFLVWLKNKLIPSK